MAVRDAHVFPGFLTPVLTQLFFPKPQATFLACFCRGERRKYAGKKVRLYRELNSQPPGHESDTLTSEPPGRGGLGTFWKNTERKMYRMRSACADSAGWPRLILVADASDLQSMSRVYFKQLYIKFCDDCLVDCKKAGVWQEKIQNRPDCLFSYRLWAYTFW